jgi:hypothetical protein
MTDPDKRPYWDMGSERPLLDSGSFEINFFGYGAVIILVVVVTLILLFGH